MNCYCMEYCFTTATVPGESQYPSYKAEKEQVTEAMVLIQGHAARIGALSLPTDPQLTFDEHSNPDTQHILVLSTILPVAPNILW